MASPARPPRAGDVARPLLEVRDLGVTFHNDGRRVHAVDGVSFTVEKGRTLGIVGESGSGKSVTSLSVMRLLPRHGAEVSGSVFFEGRELLGAPESTMRDLRGNRLAMIFQEPMTSLNPSYTIGEQITEVILRHRRISRSAARERAIAMLKLVRIPSPEIRYDQYPHNLSGGMRQRVMIAMALSCDPDLLIADEPTTALDVTIQAQVLDLMKDLQEETGTAIILITHDLGVVAEVCDDVIVMYAGQVVEHCPVEELFSFPQHPYTVGLLGSLPRLEEERERLVSIKGTVPDLANPPKGCRFQSRCPFRIGKCAEMPPLIEVSAGHFSRCWRAPLSEMAL
ncbi:ABC transporter ATP-binding protein [Chelativorans sp. AA-79]|uniref:ABC transporter ATP-binding protein n=1 Tax=Chelativorans sp. AA-79 TaxID=3028735 RepID=UPI0023F81F42|nr:ABC transporter ATP-binding protein [Chelativorans sp. AA-79]WEX11981.1 ABC transporter ATP-binding protein [Chelativorans sp. AA-79]